MTLTVGTELRKRHTYSEYIVSFLSSPCPGQASDMIIDPAAVKAGIDQVLRKFRRPVWMILILGLHQTRRAGRGKSFDLHLLKLQPRIVTVGQRQPIPIRERLEASPGAEWQSA